MAKAKASKSIGKGDAKVQYSGGPAKTAKPVKLPAKSEKGKTTMGSKC